MPDRSGSRSTADPSLDACLPAAGCSSAFRGTPSRVKRTDAATDVDSAVDAMVSAAAAGAAGGASTGRAGESGGFFVERGGDVGGVDAGGGARGGCCFAASAPDSAAAAGGAGASSVAVLDLAESLSAPLFLKNSNADGLSLAAIVDCASSISLTDMAASLRAVSSSIPLLSSSGCRAVVVGGVGWGGWGDAPATATVPPAAAAAASAAFLSLSSMNLLLGLSANGPLVRCLASGNASPGPGAVGAVGGIGAPVLLLGALSITSPTTSRISAVGSKPWAGPVPNESSSA